MAGRTVPRRRFWLFTLIALAVYGLVALLVANWVRDNALADQLRESTQQLKLQVAYVEGELARYEAVPSLLATNQRVLKVLQQPANLSARQALNEYFEASAASTGALDIYLMNARGLTVAASNWQSEKTFIGRNFAFRPYFSEAMAGRLGRYYALGTTSGQRGYYFAAPVYQLGKIIGVVVIKIDVGVLEANWQQGRDAVLVSDPDGVVFIASKPDWRYHTISVLGDAARERLLRSQRYPAMAHPPLQYQTLDDFGQGQRVRFQHPGLQGRYLWLRAPMPDVDWTLHLLHPLKEVQKRVVSAVLISAAVWLVLFLIIAIWLQHRDRVQERKRCDAAARAALEQAHGELEQRVEDRTVDLRHEIDERKRAESALRAAQNELVQATKLATLGQMSASINHELNQPLTAIRTYADNARLLLERERYDDVARNMDEITELIDRMAKISSQLKLFARKSDGQRVSVSLQHAIDMSLKILRARLQAQQVEVSVQLSDVGMKVLADETRLEQVLVNLIGNAADALQDMPQRRVMLEAHLVAMDNGEDKLQLAIRDNGPGIAEAHLGQIFDPFFTTRKSGLGLGLAISQHIVQNMGGELQAANHPEGGAVFTLTLDLALD